MSRVWHIVQKDLRRMAVPVALWCTFIVATTVGFLASASTVRAAGEADVSAWLTLARSFTALLVAAQFVVGYVLVGALVAEDALVGSDVFWVTRPVAGARLLAAKVLAAALLFLAVPAAVLMPLWLACGFSLRDAWSALSELAWQHGVLVLAALAVASLARNLAQFLFCTIALGIALWLSPLLGALWEQRAAFAIGRSRYLVLSFGLLAAAGIVLTHQFLTRRTARTWLIIGAVVAASLVVRMTWPWDVVTRAAHAPADELLADRAAKIEVAPSLGQWSRNGREVPHVLVTAPWTKEGFYVPCRVWLADGRVAMVVTNGWRVAGLRELGFDREEGALRWQLEDHRNDTLVQVLHEKQPHIAAITGELEIWVARARVLGELPLVEGAELANGADRTRIIGFQREGRRLDGIFLEERDAAAGGNSRLEEGGAALDADGHVEYYLVDRAAHRAQAVSTGGNLGVINMRSLRVTFRRLFVAGTDDWSGAVLVKVRFERDHSLWRQFEVRGLANEREGGRP